MKGRQDTGRGKLFTCYIKMKYVSKLSEIWNWKLRSNSYWRSELIKSLKMFKKVFRQIYTSLRYDQEMFDFHHKIEALEEQWGREKQDLAKVTF